MSEVTTATKNKKIPVISISRKIIQFLSFFVINYAILEWIFNADFSILDNYARVLPFLHSANSAWTQGAGLLEYSFYMIATGRIPYLFVGILGLLGLFSGRIFCGWVCPTGFMQDLFGGLGGDNRLSLEADQFLKKVKSFFLIVLLFLFTLILIFFKTDPDLHQQWLESLGSMAYNALEPISMSEFLFVTLPNIITTAVDNGGSLTGIFGGTFKTIIFVIYVLIIIASAVYPRFYCKYMCPYAATIKVFSNYSFLKLQRMPTRCPGRKECGVCEQICPMQIRILEEPFSGFTGDGECTLCLDCMQQCPHDAIKWKFGFN
ncbi:4Fe-4S binding protein [Candidatus Lokiarchaeum ossiferum]|uniref:4Fe-4S binding protein n=1 Tax=Candidatus Lokiarchaeum ossiferum TaxID=2951803 RepID=UPI00352F83B3